MDIRSDAILKAMFGGPQNKNSHIDQVSLFQALETIYIIETSNSPDTVIGRCKHLKTLFNDVIAIRNKTSFQISLQASLDQFKQTYYDRTITETQVFIITKADIKFLNDFLFSNVERSTYHYFDTQISETNLLKKETAKEKRWGKMHRSVVDNNLLLLKLFFSYDIADPYADKVARFTKLSYNYLQLKQNSFDEYVLTVANEMEYENENEAPITDVAKKLVKEIKAQLWGIQFEVINQLYKIKLKVTGNNVGLALDENASAQFLEKIKSIF